MVSKITHFYVIAYDSNLPFLADQLNYIMTTIRVDDDDRVTMEKNLIIALSTIASQKLKSC